MATTHKLWHYKNMYRPPTITDTGTKEWIDSNTSLGYAKFIELVDMKIKPAAIARACNKDSRTVRDWLNRIAHDKGLSSWHDLYN